MVASAKPTIHIVAVVVWYNPQAIFAENIQAYASGIDEVIVVDNSDADNRGLLIELPRVRYIPMQCNAGIAAALNRGIDVATAMGADWVLTMDQDSRFTLAELEKLKSTAQAHQDESDIALIGAITNPLQTKNGEQQFVSEIITSGSLNRLTALRAVGGLSEKLFIDCVDFDLCFRLRAAGYRIILDKSAKLEHRRGSPTIVTWRGKNYTTYNYSPSRYYYQVRNNLYLGREFPEYRKKARKKIRRLLQSALFFEAGRLNKLSAIAQGYLHFLTGRYGPRDKPTCV